MAKKKENIQDILDRINEDIENIREKVEVNAQNELPDEIHTSIYVQETNSDYKVVICPPCVEYHIAAKNFTFIKPLTSVETASFLKAEFEEWTE